MKLVIAGSRVITNVSYDRILCLYPAMADASVIISGGATGVDTLAEQWAKNLGIEFVCYKAFWDKYGLRAGMIRNYYMAKEGDCLLAIWDAKSSGTRNMIQQMEKQGKPVKIFYPADFV